MKDMVSIRKMRLGSACARYGLITDEVAIVGVAEFADPSALAVEDFLAEGNRLV
jgi:hypothetical protein